MLVRFTRWGTLLGFSLAVGAGMAACGGGKVSFTGGTAGGSTHGMGGSAGTTTTGSATGGSLFAGSGGAVGAGGEAMQGFDVEPTPIQTLTVSIGQAMPTVTYTATLNGMPAVNTGWSLDSGAIGAIGAGPSSTSAFTPTGTTGGLVNVRAGLNGMTLTRQVFVELTGSQNGSNAGNPSEAAQIPSSVAQLTAGGGIGGVGGEGLGGAVSDMPTLMALGAPSGNGSAQGLSFLYPYDKTVFPRGLPAPLLMWTWSTGDADAIQIGLKTASGSFSWTGTFGRPPILGPTGKFIRMPIPEDVWEMATNTAGGATPNGMPDTLTVSLTVAKGGMAYGPISETWPIAPARLAGTIYYQSYGTLLVQNSGGAVGGNGNFGAAVLSIRAGDTAPKVVAGSDSECRICHSVAAFGSRLIAMPYGNYSDFDLSPAGAVEHVMPNSGAWFPGIYPDGSRMLTGDGQLLPLPAGGTALPTSGLPGSPDMPAFSPDGKLVAFNPGVGEKLTVMSFAAATGAFTGAVTVVDDTGNALTPGWPAFFPDGKSVVFEQESAASQLDGHGEGILWTREGSKGQIAWTSVTGASGVTSLDQLNGKGYLPKLPAAINLSCLGDSGFQEGSSLDGDHSDDVDLNYEPTVNPVASGGYAWVVFTTRRMYGSVADIPPFCSDPRGVNLVTSITPKKLWVAAIDLSQAPGTDASHPAFYLPAQELLAGNSRGFWVLDPCLSDGTSCMTGDQCCNGFCEPGDGGGLVCSNMAPGGMCSGLQEKCTTSASCCDPTNLCINGFCTLSTPQ